MKLFISSVYVAASAIALVSAIPMADVSRNRLRTVHQFPNQTWIENMAIRENGQILGTDIANSRIYLVDPKCPQANPHIIAQFPEGTRIAGIVEMEPDVFYTQSVQGDLYSFQFQPNTSVVWKVDMRGYAATGQAAFSKAVDIPSVVVPNGMTVLSKSEKTILIGDSPGGKIWRVNLKNGAYEPVLTGTNLEPIPTAQPAFGVNGVQVVGSLLYFVNTNKGLAVKVPINSSGHPTGPQMVISSNVPAADDFAVDKHGNMFITQNVLQTLIRLAPDGVVQTIAGGPNSNELYGPVAARFGRGQTDRDVLYISTDGLSFSESGELLTSDGKIAAIKP